VRALMDRVSTRPHPDMADDAAEQFSAEVRITLRNGKVVARRVDGLTGRGGDNPMSSEELWEKFYDCSRRSLPEQDILILFDRLASLGAVADMRDLTRLLAKRLPPNAARSPVMENMAPKKSSTPPETYRVK
jgi:2-methylcitrate dehydratase PrpD